METSITQSLLDEIVSRIVDAVFPERVYLFGSQARGTATKDSDIDLYIIADMEGSGPSRAYQIHKLFPEQHYAMEVIVHTPAEFEKQKHWIGSIAYQVHREGRVLYDRS